MAGPWEKYASAAAPPQDGPWAKYAAAPASPEREGGVLETVARYGRLLTPAGQISALFSKEGRQDMANFAAGGAQGAGNIGATALAPVDVVSDALAGKGLTLESNRQRRADMTEALRTMGADPDSGMFQAGKLATEVAGTAGAGGATANALTRAAPQIATKAPGLIQAIRTGGLSSGGGGVVPRVAGGAVTGGISAGMVNPEDAAAGAAIGGGLPAAAQVVGRGAHAIGRGARDVLTSGQGVAPEVKALATRAAELGIEVPADRLVDSRPLNAVASSLNYVPLSGRAATEARMSSQLNQALSRTFGQDSSNVTMALRKADDALGKQFDDFLQSNAVAVDRQFLEDLAAAANTASKELSPDQAKIISNQVDEIVSKAGEGVMDGQAAYNIKKTLDKIGKRPSPEAWYALDLKGKLMDALNRSVGQEKAEAFGNLRKQYGNMLALQKLAKNGAEGEVSAARLANMGNINNADVQELADIAAQFVRGREGAHGAAQRVFGAGGAMGTAALAAMGLPGAAVAATGAGAVMGGGRAANAALNSNALKSLILDEPVPLVNSRLVQLIQQGGYKAAPVLSAQ